MRSAYISGNIGKDPEVHQTSGEWAVIKFSIGNSDESRKNDTGGWDRITSWFDVEYWTKKPDYWLEKLLKGTSVSLECDVKQSTWQNQEGQNRSKIVFKVKNGTFPIIGERTAPAQSTQSQSQSAGFISTPNPSGFDDDVPF